MSDRSPDSTENIGIYIIDDFKKKELLAQGDILFWQEEKDPLKRFGIVVTGDCDLAQDKYWGTVSVVPFFSIRFFVENFICKKLFDKRSEALYTLIIDELKKEKITYKKEEIDRYLLNAESDKKISKIIADCKQILLHMRKSCSTFTSNIEALKALYEIISCKKLKDDIANALKNPNEEFFYLGQINGEILPDETDLPAIAWLRIIREVDSSKIYLKRIINMDKSNGIRIARISSVYQYKLTQQLGQIFSSIGLPEEHSRLKKNQLDEIIKKIGG